MDAHAKEKVDERTVAGEKEGGKGVVVQEPRHPPWSLYTSSICMPSVAVGMLYDVIVRRTRRARRGEIQ